MKGGRGIAIIAVVLLIAAVLQQATAYHFRIFGAKPDFMLTALAVLGMYVDRRGGMILGFTDGLIMGGISGANLQHYVISRTVIGLILGLSVAFKLPRSYLSASVFAVAVTCGAQIILMFLTGPPSIGAFLADTIRSAVYNGVLAIPVYALLNRLLAPVVR